MVKKKSGAPSKRRPTKDRVLQARIPEHLDEELRDRAAHLGLSVSTIVRNALLHTFELVEGVVMDSAQVGRVLKGGKSHSAPATTESQTPGAAATDAEVTVVGWQEAILNLNGVCHTCNAILPLGQRAAVGVPMQARPTMLCLKCLEALTTQHQAPASDKKPPTKTPARRKKSP